MCCILFYIVFVFPTIFAYQLPELTRFDFFMVISIFIKVTPHHLNKIRQNLTVLIAFNTALLILYPLLFTFVCVSVQFRDTEIETDWL